MAVRTVTLKNVTVTEEELRATLAALEAPPPSRQGQHMDVCLYKGEPSWLCLDKVLVEEALQASSSARIITLRADGLVGFDSGAPSPPFTYVPGTLTLGVKS